MTLVKNPIDSFKLKPNSMNNANVLTFLQEFLQRLFTKSPKFFKIWTIISGALVLITGIPQLISSLPFDVHIPDLWNAKVTLAVAWASRAALFMSLLTTQSKIGSVTDSGVPIKATDSQKLPFTAATEIKSAEKHNVATVKLEVVPTQPIPDGNNLEGMQPAAPN